MFSLARIKCPSGGVSPVLSLVTVSPAITRSVLIKETIAQYSDPRYLDWSACAGRTQHRGGEYTCTSAVSTTLLLISNVTILRSSQVVFLNEVVNKENNLQASIYINTTTETDHDDDDDE